MIKSTIKPRSEEINFDEVMKKNLEVEKKLFMYYDSDNKIILTRPADCYFNWRSSQYNQTTLNKKLQELGFLHANNFNLRECISSYKGKRDAYTISSLPQSIIFYIMYIRYRDYYHFISDILSTLSEKKLIQIFIDELSLVYDHIEYDINCKFWSDIDVLEAAKAVEGNQSKKDKLITVITCSSMFKPPKSEDTEKK